MLGRPQAEGRVVLLATQHGVIMGEPREKFGFSSLPCESSMYTLVDKLDCRLLAAQKTNT